MNRAKDKAITMLDDMEKPPDFKSRLPDEVLSSIISLLLIDEGVRTSILSKRWTSVSKKTPHLDFDVKRMIYPLTGLNISPKNHFDFTLDFDYMKGILRYSTLFSSIAKQHLGNLTSCRLLHFPHLEVKSWLKILVEKNKGLRDLNLECEPLGTIWKQEFSLRDNGLDIFSPLESLELIRYSIYSPSPLGVSKNLKTLKLIEVNEHEKFEDQSTTFGEFLHPPSAFWEGRDTYNCVRCKLECVYVVGFTGKDPEVDFIRYLIKRSPTMKLIGIVSDSPVTDASELLSIERASANLSIKVKSYSEIRKKRVNLKSLFSS
ncbi:Leucine-rich repeat domain superfamily [Sesbania bispinosa]|nr:Leucine-rich repeat domain superfamily [Sesbania bispinosa]